MSDFEAEVDRYIERILRGDEDACLLTLVEMVATEFGVGSSTALDWVIKVIDEQRNK